ncbi:MAG: DNA (cytosine-5-)-methyltransferase [Alphaproteobacteria bacterium]|nr:DNA (cytosine-5-)-methyltransferase [Alphaproteobacteria bacterium]
MMKTKLTVLDLFSGIGGFSLGLERAGFDTIAFCEIEPFCRNVLCKHWPHVPIAQDIRQLRYENGRLYDAERVIYEGRIDLICGGFPCQPFSVAGRKKGTKDDRDLWPEMFRLIQQTQPSWIIGENVAHFINMAFTRTKTDLESKGYTVQPFVIPACAIGAPHRRDRVWVIAHHNSSTTQQTRCGSGVGSKESAALQTPRQSGERQTVLDNRCTSLSGTDTADTNHQRCQGSQCKTLSGKQRKSWKSSGSYQGWQDGWPVSAPRVCGVDDGIPNRTHRLKALGNAVVPQIPEIIGQAIINSIKD